MQRLAIALLVALQTVAQTGDWDNVRQLTPGQQIAIHTRSHEVVEGRFTKWSDASIDVTRGKRIQSFALADIRKVQVEQKASRWKAAMWGAVAGFAVVFPCGAARAGYITDRNNPSTSTRIGVGAGLGMFGAGIGAGIGALAGGHKYVTFYQAREKRQ